MKDTQINIKNLKSKSGVLSEFIVKDLIVDMFNNSEVAFFKFRNSTVVEYEGVEYLTVGMLLKEETLDSLDKGVINVNIQLGIDNPAENTIEPGPLLSTELKIKKILDIDKGIFRDNVTHIELEIVMLFNTLYCLSRITSLQEMYLKLEPTMI